MPEPYGMPIAVEEAKKAAAAALAGAIGLSGGSSSQDGQCARARAEALK